VTPTLPAAFLIINPLSEPTQVIVLAVVVTPPGALSCGWTGRLTPRRPRGHKPSVVVLVGAAAVTLRFNVLVSLFACRPGDILSVAPDPILSASNRSGALGM
jgi:hypothetical protein